MWCGKYGFINTDLLPRKKRNTVNHKIKKKVNGKKSTVDFYCKPSTEDKHFGYKEAQSGTPGNILDGELCNNT